MMTLEKLLDATKGLAETTPIYVTCLNKDYVLLHPKEVDSTFVGLIIEDEILFCTDFEQNETLLLHELRTMITKEGLSLQTQLMVEEDFGDQVVTDIIVLEDRIILI